MSSIDRIRHGGAHQQTKSARPRVPPPRSPADAQLPTHPQRHDLDPSTRMGGHVDLAHLYSRINHVAIWTGAEQAGPDHATFLLRTLDGHWYAVDCDEAEGPRMLLYLSQLPGIDTALLRELIERPTRTGGGIVSLWRAD